MKRIAFLTDLHLNEQFPLDHHVNPKENWERVLADLSERSVDEVVFGGDIGEASAHAYFFQSLKGYSLNIILGNHDHFSEVSAYYKCVQGRDELYYSLEDNDYKYLFLDTSSDNLNEMQLEWLKDELNTPKGLILFMHHPVLEVDTYVDKIYPLKNRQQVKKVLVDNGNDVAIFCGHYHTNDQRSYKNINQTTTQSLSFQLVRSVDEIQIDSEMFGYRMINISKDRIETEIINFTTAR